MAKDAPMQQMLDSQSAPNGHWAGL